MERKIATYFARRQAKYEAKALGLDSLLGKDKEKLKKRINKRAAKKQAQVAVLVLKIYDIIIAITAFLSFFTPVVTAEGHSNRFFLIAEAGACFLIFILMKLSERNSNEEKRWNKRLEKLEHM